jgi:hypothetical protein
MPISFPSNPTLAQTYSFGGKTWTYDGAKWTTTNLGGFSTKAYVSATAPTNPDIGTVWYDTTSSILRTWNGSSFATAGNGLVSVTGTAPTGIAEGTAWLDTNSGDLYVYSGGQWLGVTGSPLQLATVGTNAPSNPTVGQFWYDTINIALKVWNGIYWSSSIGSGVTTYANTAPVSPVVGQIWYDTSTSTNQLKVWSGLAWNYNTPPTTNTFNAGKAYMMTTIFGG